MYIPSSPQQQPLLLLTPPSSPLLQILSQTLPPSDLLNIGFDMHHVFHDPFLLQFDPSCSGSVISSVSRFSEGMFEEGISSSGISRCPFPDCGMAVKLAPRPGHEIACSPLHHLLVMCKRFCTQCPEFKPSLEKFYSIFDVHNSHICCLDSCTGAPSYKKKWCSEYHYLYWLSSFCKSLHRKQRCKFLGCPMHVFVSVDGNSLTVHDFCCWTHAQMYYMFPQQQQQLSVSFPNQVENDSCCDVSLEFVIEALQRYINDRSYKPDRVIVDESFFSKHPWDILNKPGHQSCWLIVKCFWRGPQRKLKTKDGYHWKQHGRRNTKFNNGVSRRHLSYIKLTGKKRKSEGFSEDIAFHMVEYTLNDPKFKEYCVVKLQKGSSQKGPKYCKTSSPTEQSVTSDPNAEGFPDLVPFSSQIWDLVNETCCGI